MIARSPHVLTHISPRHVRKSRHCCVRLKINWFMQTYANHLPYPKKSESPAGAHPSQWIVVLKKTQIRRDHLLPLRLRRRRHVRFHGWVELKNKFAYLAADSKWLTGAHSSANSREICLKHSVGGAIGTHRSRSNIDVTRCTSRESIAAIIHAEELGESIDLALCQTFMCTTLHIDLHGRFVVECSVELI